MKRVTIVNLGGRAFHVEEDGVAAIDAWLAEAGARLAGDPDRAELLADFERAIADKLDAELAGPRDVATAERAAAVVSSLGSVEPAEPDVDDDAAAATTPIEPGAGGSHGPRATDTPGSGAGAGGDSWRGRRLYRLADEGMVAGVCAGVAAWLRVDVTVVRVVFAVLAVLTSGFAAGVYVVMALIVPDADSPEDRAALHGYGNTAQDILNRARHNAGPALTSVGRALRGVLTVARHLVRAVLLLGVLAVVAVWAVFVVIGVLSEGWILSAFDPGTSRWLVTLFLACVAWLVIAVLLLLLGLIAALTPSRRHRLTGAWTLAPKAAWVTATVLAILGLFAIPASNSRQLSGLTDGQSRVSAFDTVLCVGVSDRQPSESERCRPGDERLELAVHGDVLICDGPIPEPPPAPEPPRGPGDDDERPIPEPPPPAPPRPECE